MKKLFCVILSAIILSTTMFAVSAADVTNSVSATPDEAQEQTAEGYCDGFYYNVLDDGTAEITEYEGDETDLIIPDYLDGYKVTVIDCAFRYGAAEKLHSVTIGKNIKTIYGGRSLYGCKNAENIFVNPENDRYYDINGVLYDRTYSQLVFYPPARTGDYHIVDGTCSISGGAFSETQLTNLYFPDSVSCFEGAFLTMTYETETFQNTRLENVFVSENNPYLYSDNGVLYSKDSFSGAIDCLVFYPPKNKTINLEIKDGVKGIHPFIQANNLKSISIPKSVTTIGFKYDDEPFYNIFGSCGSLEAVTVDSDNPVFSSQDGVLYNKQKTSLLFYPKAKKDSVFSFPNSVETIGRSSFNNNSYIKEISFSQNCKIINGANFCNCSQLETVNFNEGLLEIEDTNFENCSLLKEVSLPDSVNSLGYGLFRNCTALTKANIPKNVEVVEYEVFFNCKNLTEIAIAEGVKELNECCNYCDNLKHLTLPNSLEKIRYSFIYCSNINTVIFGKNLTTFDGFSDCYNLENIFVNDENEHYADDNGILFSKDSGELLVYPSANKTKTLTVPDGITTLPDIEKHVLTEINIPASVTKIGNLSEGLLENINVNPDNPHFYSINGVLFSKDTSEMLCYPPKNKTTELTIPDGVVKLCNIESSYLQTISIPSTVMEINSIACRELESITVNENNQSYCSIDGVLYNKDVTNLIHLPLSIQSEELFIPESVEYINSSFATKHLKNIYLNENCTQVDGTYMGGVYHKYESVLENVFVNENNSKYYSQNGVLIGKGLLQDGIILYPPNNKNKSFYFPDNTQIIQFSQRNLKYLENVYIPASADKMQWESFSWCPNLKNIYVDNENPAFCDIDGVMYNKDKTTILKYTSGREATSFAVPDTVTTISSTAFNQNYNLQSISFPDSMINFDSIFWYCNNLTDFTFSKQLKSIKWIHSIGYGFVGGMGHGGNSETPLDNVVIRGYTHSPAETYAQENGFTFISLGTINKLGDSNSDNKVDITDATNIQRYLAEYEIDFSENEDIASDTNGDGHITISDVTEIQRFLADFPSAMKKS